MPPIAAAAVGLALFLDATLGEFPRLVHPVRLFGRVVEATDRDWTAPGVVGAFLAVCLPLAAAAALGGLAALSVDRSATAAVVVAGLALFATTSIRMLLYSAWAVIDRSGSDLEGARESVVALVGRDASTLSSGELRSAAVESAAENLADGLVAPLLAFALGALVGLPFAVGAAVWVKAVNTMDSMLGYETKPVGSASARLDDVVMWLPARLSAVLLALVAGKPSALRQARRDARAPASPNSGWPMATLAAILGARLVKPGAYALNDGADLPTVEGADLGVRLVGRAGVVAFLGAGVVAFVGTGVIAWY